MEYGYGRISTPKQSIKRQIENIKKEYPNAVIIEEEFTGTKIDRPKWNKLRKILKAGDTVIFDEVSRMSRNADEGFALYKELFEEGINMVFLKEGHINSEVFKRALNQRIELSVDTGKESTDKFIVNMMNTLNEFLMDLAKEQIKIAFERSQAEVDFLHQRTREGLAQAKLNGKQIGRKVGATFETKKSIEAKKKIQKYNKDFGGSLNNEETIQMTGISRKTYFKYKRELLSIWLSNDMHVENRTDECKCTL